MNRIAVAICDTDDSYRSRFAAYLIEHRAREVTVHTFSTRELLLEELERVAFDIVFLGVGFRWVESVLRERKIPVLVLGDTVRERENRQDGYMQEEMSGVTEVFKYQSMESIIREMQVMTGWQVVNDREIEGCLPGMEVVGIYSPTRHEMQMPFAMVFASLMAEKRKVLYMNFMEYSGFLKVFGLSGENDISDIILRLRKGRLGVEAFQKSIYQIGKLYYIPPFRNPENLYELTFEDYVALLTYMDQETDFEMLVLDFGGGWGGFSGVLGTCSSIYCPIRTGYFFECCTDGFLQYVNLASEKKISDKLHFLELPYSAKRIRGGGDVLRQLVFSEFGDYVRGYFTGADYEI